MHNDIIIPNIDVNDDKVTIEDIVFGNLEFVNKDDIIFTVSTAKAVEDFYCAFSGYIVYKVKDGDEIKMGDIAAIVFDDLEEAKHKLEEIEQNKEGEINVNASKKAIIYAEEIGFDLNLIKKEGVIKVKDIDEYLEKK